MILLRFTSADTGTRVLVNLEHVAAISDVVEENRRGEPKMYDGRVKVIGSIVQTVSGGELAINELIDDVERQLVKAMLAEVRT